ncbi:cupin domain-containing protein [Rouxiella chamberiensis]|uniref:Cupin domain-containing protein n=1 Tax=Rouxiella chamberiensis TaxID=1513468 RepID=A0ABY7HRU3_9GAMM|nr:cupin domain-containing protein [Rouxiella chamberiensis]WAT01885.1 cupin domain-containing protein [Rouxiella chamberiensis]
MKVQKIAQPASLKTLEAWGSVEGLPETSPVTLSGIQKVIPGKEDIDTGIFECSAGSYRRSVKQAEIMHFLNGSGSFTPDGEETLTFTAGDAFFFEANTEGTWVIESQMRKLYVIFDAS